MLLRMHFSEMYTKFSFLVLLYRILSNYASFPQFHPWSGKHFEMDASRLQIIPLCCITHFTQKELCFLLHFYCVEPSLHNHCHATIWNYPVTESVKLIQRCSSTTRKIGKAVGYINLRYLAIGCKCKQIAKHQSGWGEWCNIFQWLEVVYRPKSTLSNIIASARTIYIQYETVIIIPNNSTEGWRSLLWRLWTIIQHIVQYRWEKKSVLWLPSLGLRERVTKPRSHFLPKAGLEPYNESFNQFPSA